MYSEIGAEISAVWERGDEGQQCCDCCGAITCRFVVCLERRGRCNGCVNHYVYNVYVYVMCTEDA